MTHKWLRAQRQQYDIFDFQLRVFPYTLFYGFSHKILKIVLDSKCATIGSKARPNLKKGTS